MANFITGREIVCGAKKASTWRQAVSLGSGDGVLITKESLGAKAPDFVVDDSLGNMEPLGIYKSREKVEGNIEGYLRFEGLDLLLALALGNAGDPEQVVGGEPAYSNTYSYASNIAGLFATLAVKKANTSKGIWEIPSAKITGFTISGSVGELATIAFDIMGNKIEIENPVNTDLSSVTYVGKSAVCRMDTDFKIRMNQFSAAALSDSDKIFPSSFELTFRRPFRDNYELGYTDMSEPTQDGFTETTIRLTFDKYNLDTFMSAIENGGKFKMDITFIGDVISGSSSNYTLRIDIPLVEWTSGSADVDGPGLISHVVEGRMMKVDSPPDGMSINGPIGIYVINTRDTNPLA